MEPPCQPRRRISISSLPAELRAHRGMLSADADALRRQLEADAGQRHHDDLELRSSPGPAATRPLARPPATRSRRQRSGRRTLHSRALRGSSPHGRSTASFHHHCDGPKSTADPRTLSCKRSAGQLVETPRGGRRPVRRRRTLGRMRGSRVGTDTKQRPTCAKLACFTACHSDTGRCAPQASSKFAARASYLPPPASSPRRVCT